MLLNNSGIISKARKLFVAIQFLSIVCMICALSDISIAAHDSNIERLIEAKTSKTRYELRKVLTDIFPESYFFEYRLIKDIITYSLDTLETKLAIDKNTDYSRGHWNNIKDEGIPVWGNVSAYEGHSMSYKYCPPSSSKIAIGTVGLDHRLLLHHRVGFMINYAISKTKISNTLDQQHKFTTPKVSKSVKVIDNHGGILILYYQYQDVRFSVDCSFLVGELQQKRNKKIDWLHANYKLYYKSKLYSANLNLSYPCFINKVYLDIILRNNINLIRNPDVTIKDMSTIKHSEIKLFRTGTGIRASYSSQLTAKVNFHFAIMLIYNYSFYLEGRSKIDIMYLGKDFYIKDYLLEKHSFNANLDISCRINRNFNIGLNLTRIQERYASSLGGRLLLYYCF